MNKKTVIASAVVIALTGAAASYASPYLTMHEMRSAMESKDADAFSEHVDFPSLRENLRAQFLMLMQQKMTSDADMKGNPFAALGMMMVTGMVNQLIDTMVTSAGVMTMMAQGTTKPADIAAAKTDGVQLAALPSDQASSTDSSKPQANYSVRYKDWSTVQATTKEGTSEQVSFVFKREGLWSWKLTGVTLPIDKVAAE